MELFLGMNLCIGVVEVIGCGEIVEIWLVLSESWFRIENGYGGEGGSFIF